MSRTVKLGFDIGGSSLRIIDEEQYITKFPSQYIEMDKKEYIVDKTRDEDVIDVKVKLSDGRIIRKRIIVGKSMTQYAKDRVELLNDKTKTKTEEIFVLIATAIHAYALENCITSTNIILNSAIILLPPSEAYSEAVQDFKRKLTDAEIILDYPRIQGRKVTASIKNVGVVPEGIAAIFAFNDEMIDEIEPRYSLIVDAGKRSTDMSLIKDLEPYNGAVDTYDIAGLTLEAYVRSEYRRMGKSISVDDAVEIISTGKYHKDTDATAILNRCKEKFINELYKSMSDLCNVASTSLKVVDNIILVGRVFKDAKGSKKMSSILQEKCPGVRIISEDDGIMNIKGAGTYLND